MRIVGLLLGMWTATLCADLKVEDLRGKSLGGTEKRETKSGEEPPLNLQISPDDKKMLMDLLKKLKDSSKENQDFLKELEKEM